MYIFHVRLDVGSDSVELTDDLISYVRVLNCSEYVVHVRIRNT